MACHFCDDDADDRITDRLDHGLIMELAACIVRGDRQGGATALDMLFRDDDRAHELIARGRSLGERQLRAKNGEAAHV